ncbi:hypothetical protein BSKO_09340 [Bryopsis sp. KO-2023]|nr:hypothetical protein BSKO_09340 [Bryopsis sp. KO-2023]
MAEASGSVLPEPVVVEYDPVTGVPSEFNEYLPPECFEYKRYKASLEGPEALEKLTLKDDDGNEIEKQLPGGKVKKKKKQEIVMEISTRSKKKSVTTVTGLEGFGIKLAEASKIFGKKFASGASVVKLPSGGEQLDIQGDVSYDLPDFLLKKYKELGVRKSHIFQIINKKKQAVYDD